MFKLTENELQCAYDAIIFHGYSAMLPPVHEWKSVKQNWQLIRQELANLDLDVFVPSKPLRIFAPKSRANIRIVHLLHPVDLIIYTALVLIIKDDIEAARMSRQARRVYSYRTDSRNPNHLYESRGAYDKYIVQLKRKAKKPGSKFVAIADIADFYPRIYQHRLENVVASTATNPRGMDVARVLVKKLISNLLDKNSYGIPVGPYASRILGEAILIDVDAHLQSMGIDYVRWVDDYNIFARSEQLAQSTVFELAEWLYTNHGLTLQSSKTKIIPVSSYLAEIISTPEENLTDRDKVISFLRETAEDIDYEDEYDGDQSANDDVVDAMLDQLQGYDLKEMFIDSISNEALIDYKMVRYVLTRLPRIPGAEESLKSEILELVLDNASLFYPVSEYVAKYVLSFNNLSIADKRRIGRKLLSPIRSRRHPPPPYYIMWILYIFSTSEDWNFVSNIVSLYQQSTSEVIKRYAALAIAGGGTRADALVVKDDVARASSLLRLAILSASNKLGSDERKHWKRANQIGGILERHI